MTDSTLDWGVKGWWADKDDLSYLHSEHLSEAGLSGLGGLEHVQIWVVESGSWLSPMAKHIQGEMSVIIHYYQTLPLICCGTILFYNINMYCSHLLIKTDWPIAGVLFLFIFLFIHIFMDALKKKYYSKCYKLNLIPISQGVLVACLDASIQLLTRAAPGVRSSRGSHSQGTVHHRREVMAAGAWGSHSHCVVKKPRVMHAGAELAFPFCEA